jgi:hypothetical protein
MAEDPSKSYLLSSFELYEQENKSRYGIFVRIFHKEAVMEMFG